MNASFMVNPIKVRNEENSLLLIRSELERNQEAILNISRQIQMSADVRRILALSLERIENELQFESRSVRKMSSTLSEIVKLYIDTDMSIKSWQSERDQSPYDKNGEYGGNQSDPYKNRDSKEIRDIVRKYFPDFSDDQIDKYLLKLESEGCGYVAMCNTLFSQFIGREEEFEKIFGFPMYDENGDFNYDALITDFYCSTDNHVQKGFLFWKHDSVKTDEDYSDTEGFGTTVSTREYRYEMYMKEHGIEVDVKNVSVSAKNFEQISQKGEVVVAIRPVVLYDKDGNKVCDISDAGHAMTVTGVTEDGMLKVSSWGKEYYIKPGTYSGQEAYQQVIYK